MKRNFIKMLCLLILGVSLVQCSNNEQNNTTNQNTSIQQNENEQNNNNSNVSNEQNNNSSNTSTVTTKVIELKDVRNSKYQSVIPVKVKSNDIGYLGTAFIVGPNTVLVNKRVVDIAEEDFQESLVISLNEENEEVLFDIENIIPFNADDYTEEEGRYIDLSIIHVSPKDGRNLSDGINIFQLASIEEIQNVREGDKVNFAGYPGETFPNLFYDETPISTLSGNFVSMISSISNGTSGFPLLNSEDKIIGVGLVNASSNDDGVSFAFLFNQTVLDFINDNIK